MRTFTPVLIAALMLPNACGGEEREASIETTDASRAALGAAEVGDQGDRACQIALRSTMRHLAESDFETDCSGDACLYRWRGTVDIDLELAEDVSVHVLYRLASDPNWWTVGAQRSPSVTPGFERYSFSISEHLFGPDSSAEADIELIPFVVLADGSRIFDHNRFPAENHRLTADNGFRTGDGGVCEPTLGSLQFYEGWQHSARGVIREGGYLQVDYALARLPSCRNTHNGFPAWDTVAHGRFSPGGELFSGSLRRIVGTDDRQAVAQPFVAQVPAEAESVELWFENFSGAGSSCRSWDSNYGNNYTFAVSPAADDPRCLDVEKETGRRAESRLVVQSAPTCLSYAVPTSHEANHCEFLIEGVGDGYMGHYGIPREWLVAYLRTRPQAGEVLNAGMWASYRDSRTGEMGQRFVLGEEVEPNLYKTGLSYLETAIYGAGGVDLSIEQFAFFIDVQRSSGEVVRLWQSKSGANFQFSDVFSEDTSLQYIAYGQVRWANQGADIFEMSRSCR